MHNKRNSMNKTLRIGLVSISDRASRGDYIDRGIPTLKEWLEKAIISPFQIQSRLIEDNQKTIEETLLSLIDEHRCHLILTTGGTGPARRDVTPEATLAIATKVLPGIAEQMRQISLHFVPTAVLSRQVAVICEREDFSSLIINLPGAPRAIFETLGGKKENPHVPGIFTAIPYCIELIGGPIFETDSTVSLTWRPKK